MASIAAGVNGASPFSLLSLPKSPLLLFLNTNFPNPLHSHTITYRKDSSVMFCNKIYLLSSRDALKVLKLRFEPVLHQFYAGLNRLVAEPVWTVELHWTCTGVYSNCSAVHGWVQSKNYCTSAVLGCPKMGTKTEPHCTFKPYQLEP